MRSVFTTAALCLSLLCGPAAWAGSLALSPLPAQDLDAAATRLALQVAQEVLAEQRPAPVVSLAPARVLAECPASEACLRQLAAQQSAADALALGVVGRQGDYHLALAALRDGTFSERSVTLAVSGDALTSALRLTLARFSATGELQAPGRWDLIVWPEPADAEVWLAGRWAGAGPRVASDLAAEELEIEVEAPLYERLQARVPPRPGAVLELRPLLHPGGSPLPAPSRWTLGAAAGALACAAAAVGFGLLEQRAQRDFDSMQLDASSMDAALARRDDGERYALLSNLALGAGGVALVGAGLTYGLDWWARRRQLAERAAGWQASPTPQGVERLEAGAPRP